MRVLFVLAALGWLISQPWMAVFGYTALIVIAIAMLWFISVSIERRTISPRSNSRTIDPNYVAALETMVAEAEAQVETLRGEIERLRTSRPVSEPDPKAALFRRVGLCENAPPWLVVAARRAYRAALHPDRHPPWAKEEAERRFKRAEATFDAITACRN
uniref:J domain-containing protein n=1 Tax=Bosea sp. NBC_00436 TaxID=2969620 RepID=A0A9E7ZS39_9HYPH